MTESPAPKSWIGTVAEHMPDLSQPHALVVGLWNFGTVMAQSFGLTSVSAALANRLS